MSKGRALISSALVVLSIVAFAQFAIADVLKNQTVVLVNNQPFRVEMPVRLRDVELGSGEWTASGAGSIQVDGRDLVLMADLQPSSNRSLSVQQGKATSTARLLVLNQTGNGVGISYAGKDLGQLAWDIVFKTVEKRQGKAEPGSTKADFASKFNPLPLSFKKVSEGPVFDRWSAEGTKSGVQLTITLDAYHNGFLDIETSLKNISAPTRNVYAAVVSQWKQPRVADRTASYDNRVSPLADNAWTGFRQGEGRHWFVQHGIDWVKTGFAGGASVAWLNDFAEAFTVHQDATQKHPGRWVGANIPQYGQEAQTSGGNFYSIIEFARSNHRSYLERVEENVFMPQGESISSESRLVFTAKPITNERADQLFIAYTGYAEQKSSDKGVAYNIGVPYVRFGTNYFPYSTLGENFDVLKLPGMDRDAYWPLAADTVKQWRLFADDIRRDLRIAKTMGFESIRLHHLELISPLDKQVQYEYLDFIFDEMRHLGLTALVDIKMSAQDTADIVKRYRPLIDGVEIDNEVLIFGINDDAPAYWKRVHDAVKAVAPDMPIQLTAHTNTGAFNRIKDLGVTIDRFGLHSYMDAVDAIPSSRGFALATASYARRNGKPAAITEWNWRGMTRMTEQDRAKVYPPIFENVLKARSIPTIYQFQFNESLAMNPRTLKGIRHYEPLWLSRRPKPEAWELSQLIEKYANPAHPNRQIDVSYADVKLNPNGSGVATLLVKNISGKQLTLNASLESSADFKVGFQNASSKSIRLAPNGSAKVPVTLLAQGVEGGKPYPGFYHAFLRLEADGGFSRYGWIMARLEGAPTLDKTQGSGVLYSDGALNFNFNRPLAVVYGKGAPVQDLETAWVLVNTLESATGRPVPVYELQDVPADVLKRGTLIVVGTAKTNSLVDEVLPKTPDEGRRANRFVFDVPANGKHGDWLVVVGAEPLDAEKSAMDLTLRYWRSAKDSAARRIGLVEKELPMGFDPAQLP